MNSKKVSYVQEAALARALKAVNNRWQSLFQKLAKQEKECLKKAQEARKSQCDGEGADTEMSLTPLNKVISEGTKHDGEKPALALVPPYAVIEIGKAMTYGAKKYGQFNYLGGIPATRLCSALFRHMYAWLSGEDNDAESGLSHLAHAGASVAMLIEMIKRRPTMDDRYKQEAK